MDNDGRGSQAARSICNVDMTNDVQDQLDGSHNERRGTETSRRETILDADNTDETEELDWSCSERKQPTANGSGRKTAGKTPERKTEKEDAGLDAERRQCNHKLQRTEERSTGQRLMASSSTRPASGRELKKKGEQFNTT